GCAGSWGPGGSRPPARSPGCRAPAGLEESGTRAWATSCRLGRSGLSVPNRGHSVKILRDTIEYLTVLYPTRVQARLAAGRSATVGAVRQRVKIGRASCRERE